MTAGASSSRATVRCGPRSSAATRVRVAGRVPHERVADWIAASDIVCQPSLIEPFGQAVLEALACERPVVATRIGGPAELVTPETGVLVDPGSVDSIAAGLRGAAELPRPNPAARAVAEEHDVVQAGPARGPVLRRARRQNEPHARARRRHAPTGGILAFALGLLLAFMVAEVSLGIAASSLALLADAGHMLDRRLGARARALRGMGGHAAGPRPLDVRFRPRGDPRRAGERDHARPDRLLIVYSAVRRLISPPEVDAGFVIVVASRRHRREPRRPRAPGARGAESLNMRGAYLHIATDLAAFVGTALAGSLILATGGTASTRSHRSSSPG